jgi:hypothetical protein
LAYSSLKQGKIENGHRLLIQALQSKSATFIDNRLTAVTGFALWYLLNEKVEQGAEIVGLAQAHPLFSHVLKHLRLKPLLAELAAALPADQLNAALERGKTLDLDTVIKEILAEQAG